MMFGACALLSRTTTCNAFVITKVGLSNAYLLCHSMSSSSAASTTTTTRIPRGDIGTLDSRAVSNHLDVVLSHLQSRRASEATMEAARTIWSLNSKRVTLIQRRDDALSTCKSL